MTSPNTTDASSAAIRPDPAVADLEHGNAVRAAQAQAEADAFNATHAPRTTEPKLPLESNG